MSRSPCCHSFLRSRHGHRIHRRSLRHRLTSSLGNNSFNQTPRIPTPLYYLHSELRGISVLTEELTSQYLAVKPHAILIEARADGDGGGGTKVTGIESNTDAVVDR
ncbi:hypothetical protein L1887_08275 [Cichorium endivia]|nr:hypothetical protein L1887_08275 [Cichorium endivia]